MRFHHSPAIWGAHPTLAAGALHASGITTTADSEDRNEPYLDAALRRLDERPVSEFPEIRAWRQAFSSMGLKPTQYRCASEALLRRLHKDGNLPAIHPLVDLCNAVSASAAIPIAVFDLAQVTGNLVVRPAEGDEQYVAFSGDVEHPATGEVIFTDDAGHAHARRWTNRQSARSAIRDATSEVLIVIEALHDHAEANVQTILTALTREITDLWGARPQSGMLSAERPGFSTSDERAGY